jgi:glycosyltransferase involved in cell wall biosynthesis
VSDGDPRPVCLVTGTVSPYRREPFRMLAEAEGVEVLAHEDPGPAVEGLTVRDVSQLEAARLAGSSRYRAVICGLGGRVALPGSYLGARRSGVPFVLWATIWAHPRTPAHTLSYLPTRYLYRRADAVVTYGRHVSAYVEARRGGRGNVFEAPQAVDAELYGRPVSAEERAAARERCGASPEGLLALFVGRLEREKGVEVLLDAWGQAELEPGSVLALAGDGPLREELAGAGPRVAALGRLGSAELPALYAAADVAVLPSIPTATFKEPWGLVVNEAMLQGTPIVASDAVGAVAGGLVRDGASGLVVPHGDSEALAARIRALARNPDLRERLGGTAARDVQAFTFARWVEGVRAALKAVRAGRDQTSW